jgi:hypothetical protein
MALYPQFELRSGDLRKLASELGTQVKVIKDRARDIVEDEAKKSVDRIYKRVASISTSDVTLHRRTGALAESLSYELFDTQYTVNADVGFLHIPDFETFEAARAHTGALGEEVHITPKGSRMLAFPDYRGQDELPIRLRDAAGGQLMTATEARRAYADIGWRTFLYPRNDPTMILARQGKPGKGGKGGHQLLSGGHIGKGSLGDQELHPIFLFHLRHSVEYPARIDLIEEQRLMQQSLTERLLALVDEEL